MTDTSSIEFGAGAERILPPMPPETTRIGAPIQVGDLPFRIASVEITGTALQPDSLDTESAPPIEAESFMYGDNGTNALLNMPTKESILAVFCAADAFTSVKREHENELRDLGASLEQADANVQRLQKMLAYAKQQRTGIQVHIDGKKESIDGIDIAHGELSSELSTVLAEANIDTVTSSRVQKLVEVGDISTAHKTIDLYVMAKVVKRFAGDDFYKARTIIEAHLQGNTIEGFERMTDTLKHMWIGSPKSMHIRERERGIDADYLYLRIGRKAIERTGMFDFVAHAGKIDHFGMVGGVGHQDDQIAAAIRKHVKGNMSNNPDLFVAKSSPQSGESSSIVFVLSETIVNDDRTARVRAAELRKSPDDQTNIYISGIQNINTFMIELAQLIEAMPGAAPKQPPFDVVDSPLDGASDEYKARFPYVDLLIQLATTLANDGFVVKPHRLDKDLPAEANYIALDTGHIEEIVTGLVSWYVARTARDIITTRGDELISYDAKQDCLVSQSQQQTKLRTMLKPAKPFDVFEKFTTTLQDEFSIAFKAVYFDTFSEQDKHFIRDEILSQTSARIHNAVEQFEIIQRKDADQATGEYQERAASIARLKSIMQFFSDSISR